MKTRLQILPILPLLFLLLPSCSQTPVQTSHPTETAHPSASWHPTSQTPLSTLKQQAQNALKASDYPTYLQIAQRLWQQAPTKEDRSAILYQLWKVFQKLPGDQLQNLQAQAKKQNNLALLDWVSLAQAWQQNQGLNRLTAIQDSIEFSYTLHHAHDLKALLSAEIKRPPYFHQVAVLLPLSGKYQQVSKQIRNGIIKHLFAQKSDLTLKFYDTHKTKNIQALYQQAQSEGADRIIGPLTKAHIQQLQTLKTPHIVALNHIKSPTAFTQFSFTPLSEASQIKQVLCYQNYRHIGILSSQSSGYLNLAQNLTSQWQQAPLHHAAFHSYPSHRPNLRKALGSLINETQSQARKANLYWLLKKKLTFTPRIRQDLEAIVLVGNRKQAAVFKPQFEFFQLQLPIYGTSKLTPEHLQNTPPLADLQKIIFPTFPVALQKNPIPQTLFEAFGWDSLTLLERQHLYAPQLCDHTGLTGALEKTPDNLIDHWLTWAIYDRKGRPHPWEPKPTPTPPK